MKICSQCQTENKDIARWCKVCASVFEIKLPEIKTMEQAEETEIPFPIAIKSNPFSVSRTTIILRQVITKTEHYFWIVPVETTDNQQPIMLNNVNLTGFDSLSNESK